MESLIMSYQPYWYYHIFIVKDKTVEVRKSNIPCPHRNIAYCSKNKKSFNRIQFRNEEERRLMLAVMGKVVGEFICDKVEEFRCCCVPYEKSNNLGYEHFLDNGVYQLKEDEGIVFERNDKYIDTMLNNDDLSKMCLSANELFNYCGGFGKNIYALHITALKVYDKPKELSDFYSIKQCKPEYSPFGYQWTWEDRHKRNTGGWKNKYRPVPIECHRCKSLVGGKDYLDEKSGCILFDYECVSKYHKPLERPPQSWQYVEEVE